MVSKRCGSKSRRVRGRVKKQTFGPSFYGPMNPFDGELHTYLGLLLDDVGWATKASPVIVLQAYIALLNIKPQM